MFTTTLKLTLAFMLCLAVAACAASAGATLNASDAGKTVRVQQGQTVEISLPGNPTTGYTWEAVPESAAFFQPEGTPEFNADSSALGSGGTMTLRFKALQKGTQPLKLVYHRTFEAGVAPLQTFEVTVVVD